MTVRYPYLKLTDWPFHTVPDEKFARFLADRQHVGIDMESLLRNLSKRTPSTIHLMWSSYGAGKTHALLYMGNKCKEEYPSLVPIYTEFPKAVSSYLDLYRSFAYNIDLEIVVEAFMEIFSNRKTEDLLKELQHLFPDFITAMLKLVQGDSNQREIALRWFRLDNPQLADLRRIGISRRIENADTAIDALSWMVRLISAAREVKDSSKAGRIIWMIDEFQRITSCSKSAREQIQGSLHSTFNKSPNCFTLFFSFTGKPSKNFPDWLSRELVDRIGVGKVIVLEPLTIDDAKVFVSDLLKRFRPENVEAEKFFPFTETCVEEVLETIRKRGEVKPRAIMQYFGAVLEEADAKLEDGTLKMITPNFAATCLKERLFPEEEREN